eukprot:1160206-Pelagomonas_calceolata.AAC.2
MGMQIFVNSDASLSAAKAPIRSKEQQHWAAMSSKKQQQAAVSGNEQQYFAGEIEFGTISQTSFAFSSINQALSIIITNLGQVCVGTPRVVCYWVK